MHCKRVRRDVCSGLAPSGSGSQGPGRGGTTLAPALKPIRPFADRASERLSRAFSKGRRGMKWRVARIGPSGAAIAAVVGSVLLSLLILAPSPEVPFPGAAPVGVGHVDAL